MQRICRQHCVSLIEDVTHSHGAEWRGRKVGSYGAFGSSAGRGTHNAACFLPSLDGCPRSWRLWRSRSGRLVDFEGPVLR
ncbi:DegT/DnrJ/EryC1/StrS family aminotransferase [Nocardioides endophyticus]|uniref:DegT/DnrJ/EryC1/StrS family aminotransferase n=1 Tax=Nocardioides endophyticus TaxID=1353775 RepID=UPI003CD0614A